MPWINYFIGCWLLIYAIIKGGVCILDLIPPQYLPFKVPFLTHDTTLAGLVLVIAFLLFSIFTFFHALSILHFLSPSLTSFLNRYETSYIIYMIMSIILTIFYSLVLFTDLPISKDPKHKASYEIIGLSGGILFFCTILILEAYRIIINKKQTPLLIILFPCIFIFIGTVVFITYNAIQRSKNENDDSATYNTVSAMLIPLVTIN
jgi:hypothetical protein